jgi:hypothetical protein
MSNIFYCLDTGKEIAAIYDYFTKKAPEIA